MNTSRRNILCLAGAALGTLAGANTARALTYPTRPVRWIVPFPAGGPSDILSRLIGQELSERMGQPFVIENRPGASGNVGTQAVVSAAPDGHTLLFVAAPNAINATLYGNLGFNFIRDIAAIASIARGALIMLVAPSFPAATVPEFLTYAKANPGKINMASAGNGTPPHVAGELFKTMTGVDMLHVPYRGVAPAITDLLGGQVHVIFDPVPSSIGYVRASSFGRWRSRRRGVRRRYPTYQQLPSSFRAMRRAPGLALALRGKRRPKSSTNLIPKSTLFLRNQR